MQIRYSNFWQGFRPEQSWFHRIAVREGFHPTVETNSKRKVDLEIASVFPAPVDLLASRIRRVVQRKQQVQEAALTNVWTTHRSFNATKSIWYTGENIRVPFSSAYSGFLSFDQDSYAGLNAYFPLWYTHLDWFGEPEFNHRVGTTVIQDQLLQARTPTRGKEHFACAFVGNPHPMRSYAMQALAPWGNTEMFGRAVGRPVQFKAPVASEFRYVLCLENDLFPGYVTEKLLDAYLCGAVPLYWGDLGKDSCINRECFINLADFDSIEEFASYVGSMSSEEYEHIYAQPFLRQLPTIQPVLSLLFG